MKKTVFFVGWLLVTGIAVGQEYYLFTGTYTTGVSKGIYVYDFNPALAKATLTSTVEAENPTYLAISKNGNYVYAANENGGDKPGSVSAFEFNQANGQLHFINKQVTAGDHPCYVSIEDASGTLVAANYSGGSLALLPLKKDGSLQPAVQVIVHDGKGLNKTRQEKSHVHAVVFAPDKKYLFAPDLGIDKVVAYSYDPDQSHPLKEITKNTIKVPPGSGPRHMVFHPSRPFAYLVEELTGTVSVYRYKNGQCWFLQRISTLPIEYKGEKSGADIHLSPDGLFVYVSNRGSANNIAIFAVEQSIGTLRIKGYQGTKGIKPRNFVIDPTGHFLLVANQDSDNIVVFKRNTNSGMLTFTGQEIKVPNPVCLKLLKR